MGDVATNDQPALVPGDVLDMIQSGFRISRFSIKFRKRGDKYDGYRIKYGNLHKMDLEGLIPISKFQS